MVRIVLQDAVTEEVFSFDSQIEAQNFIEGYSEPNNLVVLNGDYKN